MLESDDVRSFSGPSLEQLRFSELSQRKNGGSVISATGRRGFSKLAWRTTLSGAGLGVETRSYVLQFIPPVIQELPPLIHWEVCCSSYARKRWKTEY